MSSHSFALKGWSVTLVTAIFAFMTKDADAPWLVFAPVAPAVAFWCLDAYYLALERCFIRLYEMVAKQIREPEPAGESAAMASATRASAGASTSESASTPTIPLYTMRPEGMGVRAFLGALIRPAVMGLHGPILLIALIGGWYEFQKSVPALPSLERASRVHVIYSWDPAENKKSVSDLVLRLRKHGVNVTFDQDEPGSPSSNPVWMEQRFNEADYVLVICTPEFRQRFDAHLTTAIAVPLKSKAPAAAPRPAGGLEYESTLIRNHKYLNRHRPVVIPVLPDGGSVHSIPLVLSGDRYYRPEDGQSIRELVKLLKTPVVEPKQD
jgi:hypothetical protein